MGTKILVMISSLKADVKSLIPNFNLKSDCIVVNQGDIEKSYDYEHNGNRVYVIETKSRGLSRSRNLAKNKALELDYDILLFADDDVEYCPKYLEILEQSYIKQPDADIIAFDIIRLNYNRNGNTDQECPIPTYDVKMSNRKHEYFGSVRISVKTEFLRQNKFDFVEYFGAGSGIYTHGEDSLFLKQCKDKGAKIYKTNDIIAKVDFSESTWRNVSFEKICFDKGALWKALSPRLFWLYGLLLIQRMSKEEDEKFIQNYKSYLKGAKDFKNKYKKV